MTTALIRRYFKGYSAAKNWADSKNAKARKYRWVVKAAGEGRFGYYAIRYRV